MAVATACRPLSLGSITLNTTSIYDRPIIDENLLGNDEDMETLLRAIKLEIARTKTKAYRKCDGQVLRVPLPACDVHEFQSDPYWRCYIRQLTSPNHHPCCTNKMSTEADHDAVVDNRLRVYGIQNLRVVDASVMPRIVSVNINAAVVMIAEKGAHMIQTDWLRNDKMFS